MAGTRITVQNVLELVNEGISFGEIINKYYPELKINDIKHVFKELEFYPLGQII